MLVWTRAWQWWALSVELLGLSFGIEKMCQWLMECTAILYCTLNQILSIWGGKERITPSGSQQSVGLVNI